MDPTINWPQMRLPAQVMKTYGLAAPQASHFREATCAEVECPNRANGWVSAFDVTDPDKARAANMVRLHSGKAFTIQELTGPSGRVEKVVFTFAAGQDCWQRHRVALERDPVAYVRGGDFRGNPQGDWRTHTRLDDWVEDLGDNQQRIIDRINRG